MGRSTMPPALLELSNPSTPEAQLTALRNLKNDIVGHEQRKEHAVEHGVVKALALLLRTNTAKRRRGAHVSGLPVEDELRFQATLVVGSLAIGGPAFIPPLLAGQVVPPLLEALAPAETPPQLLAATLRALDQLVDAAARGTGDEDAITPHLYTRPVAARLAEILAQPAPASRLVHQQRSLAARLIAKTCREQAHRKLLLDQGVLDLLAAHMAAIAAADDPSKGKKHAEPSIHLADLLDAISAIVKDSHYNTARFVYSPHIQSLFAWPKGTSGTGGSWDRLIPRLQTLQSKSDPYTKSWPALGSFAENPMPPIQASSSRSAVSDESETPLFTWLMFAARRGEGRERLAACWLLALLKKFGERWSLGDPTKPTRERHFSYLVVPLVVKMIEEANAEKLNALDPADREEMNLLVERSPLVLAELVANNKTLQSAAVDAKILAVLVQVLKKSFEPITTSTKPLWQPKSSAPAVRDPLVDVASSTMGRPGLGADLVHAYKCRESALLALAAIADSQDPVRKTVIEMGGAPLIIDSLVPSYAAAIGVNSQSVIKSPAMPKLGNPESVLIAACKVTRSLSRSVSVLRTSLIDHGIAQPVFDLLTHPNLKVQIAATEVITNLVLEVSPMRTEIIEAGALATLCEHCRSANFDLRYGSLWALKHLCLGLPPHMRRKCLDTLGVGWLKQVLNGEPLSKAAPLGMGTPNAAGEQVDMLNAVDEPHMDLDEEPSSSEDESSMIDGIPSLRPLPRSGSRYTSATNIRDRLQQIKSDEQDVSLSSERDDIRIQEQALDFVRNFITEDKASGEMIDHLLNEFNRSEFFELLDSKLRPKGAAPPSSDPASQSTAGAGTTASSYWSPNSSRLSSFTQSAGATPQPNWAAYPATDLIIASLYILVHLANGRPSHRSLLISQTSLMQHILPLLTHPRRDVRLPCAWFVNNLVWEEDSSDAVPTRKRAQQLRALGFEEGVRALSRDIDLDVRERARTAVEQLGKLLSGDSRYTSPGGNTVVREGIGSGLGGFRGLGGSHQGR
ncbi:ARM repeat-containing protein [Bimuria novae-zelandiae CBS 107.79]|uniref:ARM repeat-containing protein n=1 Tax=Bimuria novae-zelandiae CBS 107.79 TaxID=1447943 RepID=A0A6A5V1I7_9PLEO|nr:ARM repeat-containing protein [Bimuria novae-zelandiae CBS 107.79]